MNYWLSILIVLQFSLTVFAAPKLTNTTYCLGGIRAYIDTPYVCSLNSTDTSTDLCSNPCDSEVFLLSVLKCVADIDTKKALKKAPKEIITTCKKAKGNPANFKADNLEALIASLDDYTYQNVTLNQLKDMSVISEPFLTPKKVIKKAKADTKLYRKQSKIDSLNVGSALPAFWAFVFLLRGITNFTYTHLHRVVRALDVSPIRKFRKLILLPPTFKYAHSVVLKRGFFSYSIPVRYQSLIIIGYSVVHLIIYFVHYQVVPDAIYGASFTRQVTTYAGVRSGYFMLYEIPLLILFAGRNNFLIWVTGWPIDTFNVFHRWIGRWMMLDLIFHSIDYTVVSKNRGNLGTRWGQPYWHWGFAACMCCMVIVIQGSHCARSFKYEFFLALHCILAFFFLLGAYYHADLLESHVQFVYAGFAVWAFDRLFRLVRIVFSGLNTKAETQLFPDGIIKVKVSYSGFWKYRPGSYAFIHFMHPRNFWQSHPFTLIDSPLEEDKGKVVMLMKVKRGMTKQIQEALLKQPDGRKTFRALLDGPYGHNRNLQHYSNVVMVAGGIGITGVYSYATKLRKDTDETKRFLFIWCITSDSALKWFKDELEYLVEDSRFDVRVFIRDTLSDETSLGDDNVNITTITSDVSSHDSSHETDRPSEENVVTEKKEAVYNGLAGEKIYRRSSRYDVKEAIQSEMLTAQKSTAVICCGPGAMNDDVRVTIAKNLETAKGLVDYYEEAFSW